MKKIVSFLLCLATLQAPAQELSYYLPDSVTYNPAIPKPKDIIYHNVGEWHVTHDRLVGYMQAIASAAPDRVKLHHMGFTYEGRPQVALIITSPKNHQNLESIRQQHLLLVDPAKSQSLNIDNMPVVVWVGHSIHGNEPSGANSSLLSAYYLAAAQGRKIDDLLNNTIILLDPSFNPDGLQRFSTWVNQHKSKNLVTDPASREFNEVWPGGRFNHYWFDLNRDWLPAVHVESQNRLKFFHHWKPNILTDHHEQGSNATFFFQPGVPSRVNPLTPAKNQELTTQMGTYHAAYLDRIGSLYFTKENYNDFYYGKGSTYPDVNGAIGILFEQGSSRGHLQQTNNGLLSFPYTIRNQFVTTLSTLEAARAMRKDFLNFQRDFYRNSGTDAAAFATKGYVIGDEKDHTKTREFITMLQRHQIEVYELASNVKADGKDFKTGSAFIIPAAQPQHRLIRGIFDKTLEYKDSLFYDITAWTMPLAFGLPYAELNASQFNRNLMGAAYKETASNGQITGGRSNIAYLMEWSELYAPAALYELLDKGLNIKVATNAFEMNVGTNRKFAQGTISIPVQIQTSSADSVFAAVQQVARKYGLNMYGVQTGSVMTGSDLGSSRFATVTKPSVALIVGQGVNPTDAGEVWHLMDQRFNLPLSHLEQDAFNRADLNKYTTLIMVGGNYNTLNKERLKEWIQSGGVLIAIEEAAQWAAQNNISGATLKRSRGSSDSTARLPYTDREQISGSQALRGAIFEASVDLTHPLAYGYSTPTVSLFKGNRVFLDKSRSPFNTPFYYESKPLQSGWVSKANLDQVKNSAAVVVNGLGSGKIISIADNPNFRAFWLGGSKLMMNSVFFGKLINTSGGGD